MSNLASVDETAAPPRTSRIGTPRTHGTSRAGGADLAYYERWVLPALGGLARYHRVEIKGLEHVPKDGPALFLSTHAPGPATYDSWLLQAALYREHKKLLYGLGERGWFQVPVLKSLAPNVGLVAATHESAVETLDAGEFLLILPGGLWEALRPSSERYSMRWGKRRGFARIALQARPPVILCTCPASDNIYTMYKNPITDLAYKKFKLPLPIFRGLGPTALPRPTKLTFYLSRPIQPPPIAGPTPTDVEIEAFRITLQTQMEKLQRDAVAAEGLR
jgi:1-acyl-sn-glycerol-3-phosphate acyltransferase